MLTLTAHLEPQADGTIYVSQTCPQRPDLSTRLTISCGKNPRLAERLVKAIDAGVVFRDVQVCTDINKVEYIAGTCVIYTKHMSAELRRLGF